MSQNVFNVVNEANKRTSDPTKQLLIQPLIPAIFDLERFLSGLIELWIGAFRHLDIFDERAKQMTHVLKRTRSTTATFSLKQNVTNKNE